MTHSRTRNHDTGFTLAEILVVIAIISILAAIAIPILIAQRGNSANLAAQSTLRSAMTTIDQRLAEDRGAPAGGQWNICHGSATYPVDPEPANTCTAGSWSATVASTGLTPVPSLTGTTPSDITVQGVISATGSYCLQATATETTLTYSVTDTDPNPTQQTCLARAWTPPTGVLATEANTTTTSLPAAPADVAVSNPTETSIQISWTAEANTTYQVSISGQPIKTYTAGSTGGTATCLFPADTCAGPATGNLYGGDYSATVRAQGENGWSPGSLITFTHPLP